MKPIHKVMNKIKWDPKLKEKDFTVGYYDRVEDRIIETSLKELIVNP